MADFWPGEDSEKYLFPIFPEGDALPSSFSRQLWSQVLSLILDTEKCFWRISCMIDGHEKPRHLVEEDQFELEELNVVLSGANRLRNLGFDFERKFSNYEEQTRKEKRDLQLRIQGLTEENADVSNLLQIAMVEKEAAEESLIKSKGTGVEKRTAIQQIAEWGMLKAGLGFITGTSEDETPNEHPTSCNPNKLTWGLSECAEDGIRLGSEVGKVVRNLRHEITDLRCSLEEGRSQNERLKSLTEKQKEESADRAIKIKILEERENTLAKNVEELAFKLEGAEKELTRQKDAFELEVEAGKSMIRKCQTEIAVLGEDLNRTQAQLEAVRNRMKMKEKLAETAIAAHAAIETSLRLADSRSVGLRKVIEELTKQLEEEAERGRREGSSVRRRARHVCWPWGALRMNPAGADSVMRRIQQVRSLRAL